MSKFVRVKAPEAQEGVGQRCLARGRHSALWHASGLQGAAPRPRTSPSPPWRFHPLCPGLPYPIRAKHPSAALHLPPHQPSVPQALFIPTWL